MKLDAISRGRDMKASWLALTRAPMVVRTCPLSASFRCSAGTFHPSGQGSINANQGSNRWKLAHDNKVNTRKWLLIDRDEALGSLPGHLGTLDRGSNFHILAGILGIPKRLILPLIFISVYCCLYSTIFSFLVVNYQPISIERILSYTYII